MDTHRLIGLSAKARQNERGRLNENLHSDYADPVQRFLNAIEPGSYVRPHRHNQPEKWEMFVLLQGKACILLFDNDGRILDKFGMGPEGPFKAIEIPPGTFHTLAALESETVLLELKPGPFAPLRKKDFAPWSPTSDRSHRWEAWFRGGTVGELPPEVDETAD